MKRYSLLLLVLFAQLAFAQNQTTTYYFIRHAEKVDDSKNPDLSAIGHERALQWSAIFAAIPFDTIYSTNFNRTLQTATPTATKQQRTVVNYDPKTIDIEQFKTQNKGKTVLVVGHSNSTPDFVNKLVNQKTYPAIDEKTFGHLYIVTINGDSITHLLLKLP